jgi:hypothetical protein
VPGVSIIINPFPMYSTKHLGFIGVQDSFGERSVAKSAGGASASLLSSWR